MPRYPGQVGGQPSFERHYLRNIAVGEGCNCGELVIRDADTHLTPAAESDDGDRDARPSGRLLTWLGRLFAR